MTLRSRTRKTTCLRKYQCVRTTKPKRLHVTVSLHPTCILWPIVPTMHIPYFLAVVSTLAFHLLQTSSLATPPNLIARTSSGDLTGFIDPVLPHVYQWTRVPYAEAPIGALRFLPPQPKTRSAHRLKANGVPPSCPFWLSKIPDMFTKQLTQFNPPPLMSEDCLFINVYAPAQKSGQGRGWPVLLFVHGGEWIWGGIETPYYRPQSWVERVRDVVIVQVK